MKKIRFTILCVLILGSSVGAYGQEIKWNFMMNTSQVQGTNTSVFDALERDLKEFLNNHVWTDMKYKEQERIDANMSLVVKSYADGLMACEMQVSATRPVYGTSYTTTILNVRDQSVNFHYQEFEKLEVDGSSWDNNLMAIVAYYCYMVIGCDLDSYSEKGGQSMFDAANQIVAVCQAKSDENESAGWKAFEKGGRNRYALAGNMVDARYESVRKFFYAYHRLALDNMSKNVTNGRAMIAEGIAAMRKLNRDYPGSAIIATFLDCKNDELINLFKKGTDTEKTDMVDALSAMNPTLTNRYEEIKGEK